MILDIVPEEGSWPPTTPFLRHGRPAERKQQTGAPYLRTRGSDRRYRDRQRRESISLEREVTERALEKRLLRLDELPARDGGTRAKWTRERCITALQAFYEVTGLAPRIADFEVRRRGQPAASSIRRVFGSWNDALVAAGIPVNRATGSGGRRQWSDEEILEALREADRAGEPTSAPFRTGRRLPWMGTIERRFGSWRAAKSLAISAPSEGGGQG